MEESDDIKKGSARLWTEEQLAKARRTAAAAAAASSLQQFGDDDSDSDGDDDETFEKVQESLINKLRSNLDKQAQT